MHGCSPNPEESATIVDGWSFVSRPIDLDSLVELRGGRSLQGLKRGRYWRPFSRARVELTFPAGRQNFDELISRSTERELYV